MASQLNSWSGEAKSSDERHLDEWNDILMVLSLTPRSKICKEGDELRVWSDSLSLNKVVQKNKKHGKAVLKIWDKACRKRPKHALHKGGGNRVRCIAFDVWAWHVTNLKLRREIMIVAEGKQANENKKKTPQADLVQKKQLYTCICFEWHASNHEAGTCCTCNVIELSCE